MNTAEKMTEKVNEINEKLNGFNKKVSPGLPVEIPVIKTPSRKSQAMGAKISATVGVGTIVAGVVTTSKFGILAGALIMAGASFSYFDSKKK